MTLGHDLHFSILQGGVQRSMMEVDNVVWETGVVAQLPTSGFTAEINSIEELRSHCMP